MKNSRVVENFLFSLSLSFTRCTKNSFIMAVYKHVCCRLILQFCHGVQIGIATLYLAQRRHGLLVLLSRLRAIIRAVHIWYSVVLRGAVELIPCEISVQRSHLILHLVLNPYIRRFVSNQRAELIHIGLRSRLELPGRLATGIRWQWTILIPSRSRASL